MKKIFDKYPDPHFFGIAENDVPVCEEMVEYSDLYVSKNTFVKKLYVGQNGIIAMIPLKEDNLDTNETEQKRCRACLEEIYECLGLHLYVYPIFTGQEKCFVLGSKDNFENIAEIDEPYEFVNQLCKYTYENPTYPSDVPSLVDDIYSFEPSEPYVDEDGEEVEVPIKVVLDNNTINRILVEATYLEGNERPQDNVRFDEDGTQYILRDSSVRIGIESCSVDTGLVGKKKWFRLSEENPKKYAIAATVLGWLGAHKFLHGDVRNGLFYLVTFGFLGVMPAVDLLLLFAGNYTYNDVFYEDTVHGQKRTCEKVYMKKAGNLLVGIACILASLIIGYLVTEFIYKDLLEMVLSLAGTALESILNAKTYH